MQPYISRMCVSVSVLTWICGFVDDTTQSSIPPEAPSHERYANINHPVLTLIIIMTSRVSYKVQEGSMQYIISSRVYPSIEHGAGYTSHLPCIHEGGAVSFIQTQLHKHSKDVLLPRARIVEYKAAMLRILASPTDITSPSHNGWGLQPTVDTLTLIAPSHHLLSVSLHLLVFTFCPQLLPPPHHLSR